MVGGALSNGCSAILLHMSGWRWDSGEARSNDCSAPDALSFQWGRFFFFGTSVDAAASVLEFAFASAFAPVVPSAGAVAVASALAAGAVAGAAEGAGVGAVSGTVEAGAADVDGAGAGAVVVCA